MLFLRFYFYIKKISDQMLPASSDDKLFQYEDYGLSFVFSER